MDKKPQSKSLIELGTLPPVLQKGEVFKRLLEPVQAEHKQYVNKYRMYLYDKVRSALGVNAPNTNNALRYWFIDPEKYVNGAYLENQRNNPQMWLLIVNAMYFAMVDTLIFAANESRQMLNVYKQRDAVFSELLENYLEKIESDAA